MLDALSSENLRLSQKSVPESPAFPWQTSRRVKANYVMKRNIRALLAKRGENQRSLARFCQRSESWLSKILQEEKREIPVKYFDRIADFFGIDTYQLFQPGIDPLLDRRKTPDRRSGIDRRRVTAATPKMLRAEQIARRVAGLADAQRRSLIEMLAMLERTTPGGGGE